MCKYTYYDFFSSIFLCAEHVLRCRMVCQNAKSQSPDKYYYIMSCELLLLYHTRLTLWICYDWRITTLCSCWNSFSFHRIYSNCCSHPISQFFYNGKSAAGFSRYFLQVSIRIFHAIYVKENPNKLLYAWKWQNMQCQSASYLLLKGRRLRALLSFSCGTCGV